MVYSQYSITLTLSINCIGSTLAVNAAFAVTYRIKVQTNCEPEIKNV